MTSPSLPYVFVYWDQSPPSTSTSGVCMDVHLSIVLYVCLWSPCVSMCWYVCLSAMCCCCIPLVSILLLLPSLEVAFDQLFSIHFNLPVSSSSADAHLYVSYLCSLLLVTRCLPCSSIDPSCTSRIESCYSSLRVVGSIPWCSSIGPT